MVDKPLEIRVWLGNERGNGARPILVYHTNPAKSVIDLVLKTSRRLRVSRGAIELYSVIGDGVKKEDGLPPFGVQTERVLRLWLPERYWMKPADWKALMLRTHTQENFRMPRTLYCERPVSDWLFHTQLEPLLRGIVPDRTVWDVTCRLLVVGGEDDAANESEDEDLIDTMGVCGTCGGTYC